ncbi:hypothetical protein C7E18_22285 [Stenotrophomonas maltophilia]|nr:hypothetical protein C7E18_22285 [Stenotrophomonas maltophilia]
MRLGALPVVNENDTVSVDELKLGDNDNLAATVVGAGRRRCAGAADPRRPAQPPPLPQCTRHVE